MNNNNELRIAEKIMNIERLKANILMDNAKINMLLAEDDKESDISDLISNIIINTYVLGDFLGADYEHISSKINDKLRLYTLDDKNSLNKNHLELLKNMKGRF